jgi:hypothetical protein
MTKYLYLFIYTHNGDDTFSQSILLLLIDCSIDREWVNEMNYTAIDKWFKEVFILRIGDAMSVCLSVRLSDRLSLSFENPQLVPGDLQFCWRILSVLPTC